MDEGYKEYEEFAKTMPIFDEHGNIVGETEGDKAIGPDGQEMSVDQMLAIGLKKAKEFVKLEKEKKQNKKEAEDIQDKLNVLDKELLKIYEVSGAQKLTIDGRTVFVERSLFASAKRTEGDTSDEETAAARERLNKALRDTGHGDIVVESVNAKTLAALVREFDLDGNKDVEEIYNNMPEELRNTIKVSVVPKMKSRKGGK